MILIHEGTSSRLTFTFSGEDICPFIKRHSLSFLGPLCSRIENNTSVCGEEYPVPLWKKTTFSQNKYLTVLQDNV